MFSRVIQIKALIVMGGFKKYYLSDPSPISCFNCETIEVPDNIASGILLAVTPRVMVAVQGGEAKTMQCAMFSATIAVFKLITMC